MLWTSFPDELDRSALGIVLDAWRGRPVDHRAAVLCAFNVAGYVYGRGIAPQVMASAEPQAMEVDAESAVTQAVAADPTSPEAMGAVPWGVVLTIALEVLRRFVR